MKRMSRFLKPILFSCLVLWFVFTANADGIVYDYDATGARYSLQREINLRGENNPQDTVRRVMNDRVGNHRITIYPNPTDGQLAIEIDGIELIENALIVLYSTTGTIVYNNSEPDTKNDIDLSQCPDGVYLLIMRVDGETSTWKIIKN